MKNNLKKMKVLLSTLLKIPGPSGYETLGGISQLIYKITQTIPDVSVEIDSLGNVICTKRGRRDTIVLLEAHLDEVGFLVSKIISRRNVVVLPIGEVDNSSVLGSRVVIQDYDREIARGIITQSRRIQLDAAADVRIGNWCYFERNIKIQKDTVIAPALDNRVSCLTLLEILQKAKPNVTLKALFSTQHEQGSKINIYRWIEQIKPSFIFILDSAYAQLRSKKNWTVPQLGSGPAIQFMGTDFVVNWCVVNWITGIAIAKNIPYQLEIPDNASGATNANKIPNNIPFAVLNIPVALQHTAAGKANFEDIQNTINLLRVLLETTETNF